VTTSGSRDRATTAVVVGYGCTLALAFALLLVVNDTFLAAALVSIELSVAGSVHWLSRRPGDRASTAPVDPSLPMLDRPGHQPASRRDVWLVVGGLFGFILLVAVVGLLAGG
jgi:hypothetical protein